jgi:hypothetical protein
VHGLPDLFGLVEWTYLVLLAWLALAGPGRASLDQLLFPSKRSASVKISPEGRGLSTGTV